MIDGFRNPGRGIVPAAGVLTALSLLPGLPLPALLLPALPLALFLLRERLAPLHPAPQPETPKAVIAKKKPSPTAVRRGAVCVQIKDEIKQILYMTREGGKNITEIRAERPEFRFWKIVEELPEEDRYIALHPNQWEPGYPALLLSKYFSVSKPTIRDYITAFNRTHSNEKRRDH
jgi:hypothetical protein